MTAEQVVAEKKCQAFWDAHHWDLCRLCPFYVRKDQDGSWPFCRLAHGVGTEERGDECLGVKHDTLQHIN